MHAKFQTSNADDDDDANDDADDDAADNADDADYWVIAIALCKSNFFIFLIITQKVIFENQWNPQKALAGYEYYYYAKY